MEKSSRIIEDNERLKQDVIVYKETIGELKKEVEELTKAVIAIERQNDIDSFSEERCPRCDY